MPKWNRNSLNLRSGAALILVSSALTLCLFPCTATAGLILNAELRFTYEDNVFGPLSDQLHSQTGTGNIAPSTMMAPSSGGMGSGMGGSTSQNAGSGTQSAGDFSGTLYAEAGGYQSLGTHTEIFAKGFAEHTSYNTYTDLNATICGIGTGIDMVLSDNVAARVAILGKVKRFGDSERDSTSYGGNIVLKERITPSLWIRETGAYENNNASSSLFTYTATTIGINAGYSLSINTLVILGYSYLIEQYDEPSGTNVRANTAFLIAEHKLTNRWALAGEYDRQVSKGSTMASSVTDNIFSLSLRYYY